MVKAGRAPVALPRLVGRVNAAEASARRAPRGGRCDRAAYFRPDAADLTLMLPRRSESARCAEGDAGPARNGLGCEIGPSRNLFV